MATEWIAWFPDAESLITCAVVLGLIFVTGTLVYRVVHHAIPMDEGVAGVDRNRSPDLSEKVEFDRIARRLGRHGHICAVCVGIAAMTVIVYFDLYPPNGRDQKVAFTVLVGLIAHLFTYAGRVAVSRCPRCRRHFAGAVIHWWLLESDSVRDDFITLKRCPYCNTRFRWPLTDMEVGRQ